MNVLGAVLERLQGTNERQDEGDKKFRSIQLGCEDIEPKLERLVLSILWLNEILIKYHHRLLPTLS